MNEVYIDDLNPVLNTDKYISYCDLPPHPNNSSPGSSPILNNSIVSEIHTRPITKFQRFDLISSTMNLQHDKGIQCLRAQCDSIKKQLKRRLVLDTPFSTRSTVSYGLIVYAKDTQRWAIIQRKHSVEFLLFIRGLYRLTHLPLLLSCITSQEATTIESCLKGGPDIFKHIYLTDLQLDENGLQYGLIRIAESRNIVSTLLSKLDLSQNQLRWTWPKGRLHISSDRETPFACARREFAEEVELQLPPSLFISDTYVSEIIRTITGRNIESRYWIYIIPNEIPMTPPKFHPEVSNREWATTETCRKVINQDKLFNQIVNMIETTVPRPVKLVPDQYADPN